MDERLPRALRSLEGLATCDAFGELFFSISPESTTLADLPATIWPWTDDTHMVLSLRSAAHHLASDEEAFRWAVRGRGDCDTTCAVVGGIIAFAATDTPAEWLRRREPLPAP